MHFGRWASAGFLCGLGLAACKTSELNSEHCANNEGDATCLSRYPDGSRPFCGRGSCFTEVEDGCVTDRPSEDSCASPCGGQTYADEPDGLDCVDGGTATAGDDDGGMTTGPTGDGPGTVGPDTDTDPSGMTEGPTDGTGSTDDGPMGCTSDDECTEADAPFCVAMICSACSATDDPDAACAEKFPETPACEASMCVQCAAGVTGACMGTTPICDVDANTCVGCTSHADCPDSACHIPYPDAARATALDGACFDPTTVVHVDGDGGQAFTTIQAAVNAFGVGEEGVIIVHDAPSYDEAVSVTSNRVLAIMAASGETPQWVQTDTTGSQLSITDTSTTVFLDRMRLAGNLDGAAAAVTLSNGRVHAQRTAIVGNNGGGIAAESGALVYLENSVLGNNGGEEPGQHGLRLDGSSANILYTTIARNDADVADSILCTGTTSVVMRNSIASGQDASSIDCDGIVVTNSALDQNIGANMNVGASPTAWYQSSSGGDFHLTATGEAVFCGVASWQAGDPATDIDGEARPVVDGSPDCAGADVPTP